MSADSHDVCPKCYPEIIGRNWEEILKLGLPTEVRENYQIYIYEGKTLVTEYRADCWDCGWHFEIKHEDELT
jgi:hypothetical protein